MNSKPQLDHHPDAESLNAFAEQALAVQERGKILAHLAECSRCRQVVYLAQETAAEMEPAATAPAPGPAGRRKFWLRNWWLVWAPVGALAAIVSLAYVVHLWRVEMAPELAKVVPQAVAQNEEISAKSPAPPTEMQSAPPPVAVAPSIPAPKSPGPHLASAFPELLPLSNAVASGGETRKMSNPRPDEAALPPGAPAAGYPALSAAAEYKAGPATAMREVEQERAAGSQSRAFSAQSTAKAKTKEQAQRETSGGMLTAAAPAPTFTAASPPPGSLDADKLNGAGGVFAVYKANPTELPSGLAPVSTATVSHLVLAVDRLGSVYLSEDSGSTWASVAKQWMGRAASVRLQPAVNTNGEEAYSAPSFEIVNDVGLVWVSTDGRTWKAK